MVADLLQGVFPVVTGLLPTQIRTNGLFKIFFLKTTIKLFFIGIYLNVNHKGISHD
jgi:hypothetical protein